MTTFTLDTSGAVPMPSAHGGTVGLRWDGLDAFTQGYAEALLRELDAQRWAAYRASCARSPGRHLPVPMHPAFSWLAPGTLDRIIEDCAKGATLYAGDPAAEWGADFWGRRQRGQFLQFPLTAHLTPLKPHLGLGGKVYLREVAGEPQSAAVAAL